MSGLNNPRNAYTHHLTVGGVTFTFRTWGGAGDYREGAALVTECQVDGEARPSTHIPEEGDAFSWPATSRQPLGASASSVLIAGEAQAITPGPLKSENTLRLIGPIRAPVATIVEERPYGPGGAETRQGPSIFVRARTSLSLR
jgi:hypothetical protein